MLKGEQRKGELISYIIYKGKLDVKDFERLWSTSKLMVKIIVVYPSLFCSFCALWKTNMI